MTVHVDSLSTEVVAEPESSPLETGEQTPWEELERLRALRSRLERDRLRTHAAAYDD
jgi:hypothetical protein